jgi:hypothetical protein
VFRKGPSEAGKATIFWLDHILSRLPLRSAYDSGRVRNIDQSVEETPMPATERATLLDPDVYDAVFTTLLEYHPNDILSTRDALLGVRHLLPDSSLGDEELVALIVKVATGTTMMVSFDHREAA